MRTLTALVVVFGIGALGPHWLWGQAQEQGEAASHEQAAQEAAEPWLDLIANEQYDESWQEASAQFRDAVRSADVWIQQISNVVRQAGALQSRRLESAQYTTQVPDAPPGEYVVLTYASAFENLASARELVMMVLEDGRWRVTGYFVTPAESL